MLWEAIGAALLGVTLLWLVLEPLAGRSGHAAVDPGEPPELEETARGRALLALKDVEFDHATESSPTQTTRRSGNVIPRRRWLPSGPTAWRRYRPSSPAMPRRWWRCGGAGSRAGNREQGPGTRGPTAPEPPAPSADPGRSPTPGTAHPAAGRCSRKPAAPVAKQGSRRVPDSARPAARRSPNAASGWPGTRKDQGAAGWAAPWSCPGSASLRSIALLYQW